MLMSNVSSTGSFLNGVYRCKLDWHLVHGSNRLSLLFKIPPLYAIDFSDADTVRMEELVQAGPWPVYRGAITWLDQAPFCFVDEHSSMLHGTVGKGAGAVIDKGMPGYITPLCRWRPPCRISHVHPAPSSRQPQSPPPSADNSFYRQNGASLSHTEHPRS